MGLLAPLLHHSSQSGDTSPKTSHSTKDLRSKGAKLPDDASHHKAVKEREKLSVIYECRHF